MVWFHCLYLSCRTCFCHRLQHHLQTCRYRLHCQHHINFPSWETLIICHLQEASPSASPSIAPAANVSQCCHLLKMTFRLRKLSLLRAPPFLHLRSMLFVLYSPSAANTIITIPSMGPGPRKNSTNTSYSQPPSMLIPAVHSDQRHQCPRRSPLCGIPLLFLTPVEGLFAQSLWCCCRLHQ